MKKKNIFEFISFISIITSIVFIIISLLSPLANAFRIVSGTLERDYGSAYTYIFGGNISLNGRLLQNKFIENVSIYGVISFCLILISLILIVFCSVFHKINTKKLIIIKIISAILLFLSGILLLVGKNEYLTSHVSVIYSNSSQTVINTNIKNSSLLFGIWGATLFSILASFCISVNLIFSGSFSLLKGRKNEK